MKMLWPLSYSFKSGPTIIAFACFCKVNRTYLKNRILVQDRGGAEFLPLRGTSHLIPKSLWVEPGGILLYVEDFKRGTNKELGPKDIFEIGSKKKQSGKPFCFFVSI